MEVPGETIHGWMTKDELTWLHDTASTMSSIVEIGCWRGRSTTALLTGCPGLVYAVDHWLGSEEHQEEMRKGANPFEEFQRNCGRFSNLRIVRKPSMEAAADPSLPYAFDMVFIDGAHDYASVMADLRAWGPRATKLLCGHDRCQDGVPQALRDYFGEVEQTTGIEYCVKQGPNSIWCVEKSLTLGMDVTMRRTPVASLM